MWFVTGFSGCVRYIWVLIIAIIAILIVFWTMELVKCYYWFKKLWCHHKVKSLGRAETTVHLQWAAGSKPVSNHWTLCPVSHRRGPNSRTVTGCICGICCASIWEHIRPWVDNVKYSCAICCFSFDVTMCSHAVPSKANWLEHVILQLFSCLTQQENPQGSYFLE